MPCRPALALFVLAILPATRALAATATAPTGAYDTAVQQFLGGQWDDLQETLAAPAGPLAHLAGGQKEDVDYIRQCVTEGRPPWWKHVKAKEKTAIRCAIFGKPLDAAFDPAGKGGVQMNFSGGRRDLTVSWPVGDMDNPATAEHGFTKGELGDMGVFGTLGMAAAQANVPLEELTNPSAERKLRLGRVVDLYGNLAAAHYGIPGARQWCVWLCLHSYQPKYAQMPTLNGRKAIAVAFLIDVLTDPKRYPSVRLPATLDPADTEAQLALAVHGPLEKARWTFAEDRQVRALIEALYAANEGLLRDGDKVALPAGLSIALDRERDRPFRAQREAWYKERFDAAKK